MRRSIAIAAMLAAALMPGYAVAANRIKVSLVDGAPSIPCGAAVGRIGDRLVVAGGMGADGMPTDHIHVFGEDGEVDVSARLPAPNAFAAVVSARERIYIVGGSSGAVPVASVCELMAEDASLSVVPLPDLPSPRALCGAAVLDGFLYVVGGFSGADAAAAKESVVRLPLDDPAAQWMKVADLPAVGRIWPTVTGFYGELHVFGGAELDARGVGGARALPLDDAWGYREKPLDGTTRAGWRELARLSAGRAGASAIPIGQTHALFLGGADTTFALTEEGIPVIEAATDSVWVYHNVTDTWLDDGVLAAGVCGAAAFPLQETYVVAGGTAGSRMSGGMQSVSLERQVKKLRMLDYTVMLAYFGFMAWIGVYFARKQNSSDEFALGNRKVKWWAAGVSMFATGASSISFMAIPAQAFRTNLVWFCPTFFIIPLAILQAYVVYPVLRRLNLTSTYEYLELRYHPWLRFVASAQMIMFQLLGRMSVVMLLPSLAISAVTGLPVLTSVLLMGLLTTIYTAFGGFEAVIWTDFSQGVLMLFGGLLMIVMAIGGLPGGIREFIEVGREYSKFNLAIWDWDYTMPIIWIFGLQLLLQNLAFAADQPIVQRVYATPLRDMRKLAAMFAFCSVAIACLASFSGLAIFSYFRAHPALLDPTMNNDQVVPLYIVQRLPAGIAGLIIAALFAASMSTLSSSMNSVATVTCEDFYRRIFHHGSDKDRLRFMKLTSLVVGVIGTGAAAYMGTMNIRSMFETWNVLVALLGGGFIGIYILGMFTRRTNAIGAVVGALSSIVVTVLVRQYSPLHWTFYGPVAVLTCLVVGYTISIVTGGNRKELCGLTVFDMRRDLGE